MEAKIPRNGSKPETPVMGSDTDARQLKQIPSINTSNPLVIEGHPVFGRNDHTPTLLGYMERAVRESMECTSDPLSVRCAFHVGRLTGVAQNRNIILPIQNESVLENDDSKVKFTPEVSQKCIDALYMDIFTSQTGSYKLMPDAEFLEIEVVSSSNMDFRRVGEGYEGFHHTRIYRVPYSTEEGPSLTELQCWDHNTINNVVVYRPQSQYHYRLQTSSRVSTTAAPTFNESEVILKLAFRHVRNYKTCKNGEEKLVKWELSICSHWDITVNDEIVKMPIEELFKCLQLCLISGKPEAPSSQLLDREVIEESRRQYLELSVNGPQLVRQFLRLTKCKDNRFGYIIAMVRSNLRMLMDHFDSTDMELCDTRDFYPNRFGGTAEDAQIHYDTRKLVRQRGSAIEALRRHNNLIKRIMIANHVRRKASVLDLACGHCQDMDKYATVGISRVLGIDISLAEITEARRRYSQHKRGGKLRFSAEFHHGNCLDEKVYSTFVRDKKFDVVSLQLAIHYIISDEDSATMLLRNIHKALSDKGIFMGSTICCKAVSAGLLANPPHHSSEDGAVKWEFGNSIYKVSMEEKSIERLTGGDIKQEVSSTNLYSKLESYWGLKYHFFLMETIDAGEYVVPWKSFSELCLRVGFRLIETFTFPEYAERTNALLSRMHASLEPSVVENILQHLSNMSKVIMSKDQQEAFMLYRIFVFEKVTGRDKMYMQGVKIRRV